MVTQLGKFFFLLIVLGNLSFNHFLLGYCHHVNTVFFSHCPCDENLCPCGECQGEEGEDDCSTYLNLELDKFSRSLEETKPLVFEEMAPVEFLSEVFEACLIFQAYAPSNQPTGPPGSPLPLRHLYAVYLI